MAAAYRTRFHGGGKSDTVDRYFDDSDMYDQLANTTSVLPPFPGVEEEDVENDGEVSPQDVQVYLDNYLRSLVDNIIYKE